MDRFLIQGGRPLSGLVRISGAKNAALPALAATLLSEQEVILERVPQVRDIGTMIGLLEYIGAEQEDQDQGLRICARQLRKPEAPYDLVRTMRASSLVLGPLVARTGKARVSAPGGCAIGSRPINYHLAGLERLGATIHQEHGYLTASAPGGLRGASYRFERPSVTGTEDLMMAATLARGETILDNAALEPEVTDLANLLRAMGAEIHGDGTATIRIRGRRELGGAHHRIIADRIEAATFLVLGAACGGKLTLTGVNSVQVEAVIRKLHEAGVDVATQDPDELSVDGHGGIDPVDIVTREFPGFPTDMQAQWMALMTQAEGQSEIVETIFENRFMHVQELARMGADITVQGNRARVRGKTPLTGASIMASDLRASASLVIAALAADGETVIDRVYHIDRGYEGIEDKLKAVGADIKRVRS